jgi:CheY-like chemotaxis protein
MALTSRPDIIILDVSMPLMDGISPAKRLKALMPGVPILLFTQYPDLGKNLLAGDIAVDGVVSKGNPNELMRHVTSLI